MGLAIRLARLNLEHGTGGPFGAAIFNPATGMLVSAGINLVVASKCSIAHAEIVAIAIAQQILGSHDLGATEMPSLQLVTSAEPCAMCLGAIPWSGLRSVVCGARDEDIRAIGFDEGPKTPDWPMALEARGIAVVRDVGREDARKVLQDYLASGKPIYNGRSQ